MLLKMITSLSIFENIWTSPEKLTYDNLPLNIRDDEAR